MKRPVNSEKSSTSTTEMHDWIDKMARNNPAFHEAFSCLKAASEISIVLNNEKFALLKEQNEVRLLAREARKAQVQFSLNERAVEKITSANSQLMGELGVQVLKLIASGEVKVQIVGSVLGVLTGGYLKIIQKAGPEFMSYLASKGFSSLGKITRAIKQMR